MKQACETFLKDRLEALVLADGYTRPYRFVDPGKSIYFGELPRDFLKDNDYAVACLPLRDATRKNGRLIAKAVNQQAKTQTLTRRRYNREILYRIFLYAKQADELWGGNGYIGLVDLLTQGIANYHHISATDNSAILIDPQDVARPWDSDTERDRKLERPTMAIVRVEFKGGVQTVKTEALIPAAEVTPIL